MTSYRPICDVWVLARGKLKKDADGNRQSYYGSYPSGFLHRARELLGVSIYDSVLHVCSGKVKDYPIRGFGPNDKTVDLDPELEPDFCMDVRKELPLYGPPMAKGPMFWPAILADPPYTESDAEHYSPGSETLPDPNKLLRLMLEHVQPGGRVGMLHYFIPRPPKTMSGCKIRFVACVGVMVGYGNRIRAYTVYEKEGLVEDV